MKTPTPMPLLAALWAGACLLGGLASCVLELSGAIACGDGFVDQRAGEQCDPMAPESYQDGCRDTPWPLGTARCDPVTCELRNGPEDCAACGDGKIDEGEQCDDSAPVLQKCLDGSPNVVCQGCELRYDLCPTCGNGKKDEGEQCDWKASGDILVPVSCKELESPVAQPFTFGTAEKCQKDCTFDLSRCSFCNNGQVDMSWLLPGGALILPEACDGEFADPNKLEPFCRMMCTGTVVGDTRFECDFECADDCLSLLPAEPKDSGCCLARDEPCPLGGDDPFPCCIELNDPGAPAICSERFGKAGLGQYCN